MTQGQGPRRGAQPRRGASSSAARRPAPQKRANAAPRRTKPAGQQPDKPSPPKKEGKAKRVCFAILRVLGCMVCLGVMAVSVVGVLLSLYLVDVTQNDDELLDLSDIKLNYSSVIYYRDTATGEWTEYQKLVGEADRTWVEIGDIPMDLQNAFIAAEDRDFKTHSGVNFQRTIFAIVNELYNKVTHSYLTSVGKQGASTIDQQLVKNILDDDASQGSEGYLRKIREIFRAYMLDKRYSKDIIMEAYLNTLSLTGNKGGVAAGAQDYFGKTDLKQLTLAECASIACITKNPTAFNPRTQPQQHIKRRNYVLYSMLNEGMITQQQYDAAVAEPLRLAEPKKSYSTQSYSWFTDQVIEEVLRDYMAQYNAKYGEGAMTKAEAERHLYNDGWRIYTTLVPEVQDAMERHMVRGDFYESHPVEIEDTDAGGSPLYNEDGTPKTHTEDIEGGMAVINYDGELCGVVGSLEAKTGMREFNRGTQMHRQIGSTMKPIGAYALGIEQDKINYSSSIMDSAFLPEEKPELNITEPWPRNYAGAPSDEPVLVYRGLAKSLNTIAVRVGDYVGAQSSYDFLTNILQIDTLHPADISLSPMNLGALTEGMSPYQLAGAYMMFGNGGVYKTPHAYVSVEDRSGEEILTPTVTTTQAISPETAMIMNKMLHNVLYMAEGTASGLYPTVNDMDSAGKTGTTQDDKDHWWVGLTPYYVTAGWMGYDTPTTLPLRAYSKHPPTLTWRAVMNEAQESLEFKAFPTSENVYTAQFCTETGDIAGPNCPATATGYYKKDGILPPADPCYAHS